MSGGRKKMWANQSVYQIKLNIKYDQSNDLSTCKIFLGRENQIEGGPPYYENELFLYHGRTRSYIS